MAGCFANLSCPLDVHESRFSNSMLQQRAGAPSTTCCEVKVDNVAARQRDRGARPHQTMRGSQGCRMPRDEVLLNEAISCGQSSGNWGQALDLLCGWRRRGGIP